MSFRILVAEVLHRCTESALAHLRRMDEQRHYLRARHAHPNEGAGLPKMSRTKSSHTRGRAGRRSGYSEISILQTPALTEKQTSERSHRHYVQMVTHRHQHRQGQSKPTQPETTQLKKHDGAKQERGIQGVKMSKLPWAGRRHKDGSPQQERHIGNARSTDGSARNETRQWTAGVAITTTV